MTSMQFLGIYREVLHSPEREFDDHEILRLTGKSLSARGFNVMLKKPEDVYFQKDEWHKTPPAVAFVMCEQTRMIEMLAGWESKGTIVINPTRGILNQYRYRMLPLLQSANVPVPKSEIVSTDPRHPFDAVQHFNKCGSAQVWVKRGDVHNTGKGDVFRTNKPEEAKEALDSFNSRGIEQAVFQEHIEGDLIKFYGVAGLVEHREKTAWFKWFYHKNQQLKNYKFNESHLMRITQAAARCMDLKVYGGDCIVAANGEVYVIDINAWPSFALFRDEASASIAEYLASEISETAESSLL